MSRTFIGTMIRPVLARALISQESERAYWRAALAELCASLTKADILASFADTVDYLTRQLKARGIAAIEGVTGDSDFDDFGATSKHKTSAMLARVVANRISRLRIEELTVRC